jgi:hypothetical protein
MLREELLQNFREVPAAVIVIADMVRANTDDVIVGILESCVAKSFPDVLPGNLELLFLGLREGEVFSPGTWVCRSA